MWHTTTDEQPREGARIVAMGYHRTTCGVFHERYIDNSSPLSPLLSEFDFWAYAPGESEHASK